MSHSSQSQRSSTRQSFSILQYNVHVSKNEIMVTLLKDENILKYDIIVIQKSWRNLYMFTTHNSIRTTFNLIFFDSRYFSEQVKICFFVHRRISKNKIIWLNNYSSNNSFCIEIKMNNNSNDDDLFVRIHNIYNSSQTTLRNKLSQQSKLTVMPTIASTTLSILGDKMWKTWGIKDLYC